MFEKDHRWNHLAVGYMPRSFIHTPWTALASLVISVIALAFSFVQWSTNTKLDKIQATVSLSSQFMTDSNLIRLRGLFDDYLSKRYSNKPYDFSVEELIEVQEYFAYLEYVAQLLNEHRIDENYLSAWLNCRMHLAAREAARGLGSNTQHYTPPLMPNLKKIESSVEGICIE